MGSIWARHEPTGRAGTIKFGADCTATRQRCHSQLLQPPRVPRRLVGLPLG